MKAYQILIFNALVLIGLGVYGYITSGSATALIAPGIGVILFALSFPVKKENATAAHIAAGLTLISAVTFFVIGFRRSNTIVIVMAVVTLICLLLLVMDFMKRKKARESK